MATTPSATKAEPSSKVGGLIDAGVWLQMTGDLAGARDVFQRALEREPSNARVKRLYEQCVSAAGHTKPEAPAKPPDQTIIQPRDTAPEPPVEKTLAPPPVPLPPAQPPKPADETIFQPREPAPAGKSMRAIHDDLLRIAKALLMQGSVEEASSLVHRALLIDDRSLDAYETAFLVLRDQDRGEAAAAAILKFVTLCIDRGEIERARPYLPLLRQMSPSNPTLARLTGDDTLPPSDRRYEQATVSETSPLGARR